MLVGLVARGAKSFISTPFTSPSLSIFPPILLTNEPAVHISLASRRRWVEAFRSLPPPSARPCRGLEFRAEHIRGRGRGGANELCCFPVERVGSCDPTRNRGFSYCSDLSHEQWCRAPAQLVRDRDVWTVFVELSAVVANLVNQLRWGLDNHHTIRLGTRPWGWARRHDTLHADVTSMVSRGGSWS